LVGKLRVHDASEGHISDVAGFGNYAYLGAYLEGQPPCQKGGIYVVDISNPTKPKEVGFIRSANDTYVSEGVQVLHIDTSAFNGDLLVHNNESCMPTGGETHGIGGIGLVDVTDPRKPKRFTDGVGDVTPLSSGTTNGAHEVHSAFAWDAGDRAYVILVDDEEVLDVDIMDITDPRNPVLIKETGLPDWPGAQDNQSAGLGNFSASFLHDLQVRQFGSKWIALLSYWDTGWVLLDVTDPANPVFIDDTTYPDPDSLTDFSPPEGNAHQAWWSADGNFFMGTDEDFDPFRFEAIITSGPFAEEGFGVTQGDDVPQIDQDRSLIGPTVFVGRACSASPPPTAPSTDTIAVVERGDCTFTEKVTNVSAAGYAGGIVFNTDNLSSPPPICEGFISMLVSGDIPFLFTNRSSGFRILGITGYDPANCPSGSNPVLPSVGAPGSNVSITVDQFDGWGYIRLFDAGNLREIDAFAIPQALDPAFSSGFGDLSVHEVETDDTRNLFYSSYYAGGFRVFSVSQGQGIEEVGHYIDADGNNFWGIDPHVDPRDGSTIILASDRDSGLWIFKYTGP
jgi:hypothetical protein